MGGNVKREVWMPHETRTKIYVMIAEAGKGGVSRLALTQAVERSGQAVDFHLSNLVREQYVRRPMLPWGGSEYGRYVAGPRMPPIAGMLSTQALAMVDDCPAGVSATLMCKELGCTLSALYEALERPERDGLVQRVMLPATHGGGVGWQLPEMDAARDVPEMMHVVHMQHEHEHVRQQMPMYEVDIDRIHRKAPRPDVFDAEMLDDGRLRITSGSLTMTLPERHTDRLLHYLVPHLPRPHIAATTPASSGEQRP